MSDSGVTRSAAVVHADGPVLPLIANLMEHGFSAVTQDGWSTLVLDDPSHVLSVAAAPREDFCVTVTSNGTLRGLTVYPPIAPGRGAQRELERQEQMGSIATLEWGESSGEPLAGASETLLSPGTTGGEVSTEQDTKVAVAAIASLCDLDAAATSRLENYALSPGSALVLESVLQLLGVPVIAAKIVESQRELADLEDARRFDPRPTGLSFVDAMTVPPSGHDVFSRLHRTGLRHPTVLLAVSGAEVAAATALAIAASRGGRAARVLGTASALLLTDAAGQTALWAAVRARKKS